MQTKISATLLTLTLALTACQQPQDKQANANNETTMEHMHHNHTNMALTEAMANTEHTFSVGQTFTINLKGNVTTGFSWQPQLDNSNVVVKSSEDYKQDNAPAGNVGMGGTHVFGFTANKAGKTTITLTFAQAWDKNTPASKTVKYTIIVN